MSARTISSKGMLSGANMGKIAIRVINHYGDEVLKVFQS